MIASFSNNFIFLRTRKTAGTSVEIVLSTWCEKPDICTRIAEHEEPIRQKYGGLRPMKSFQGKRVYHHMPAREVRDIFPDLWNRAHKFVVERHPYEKVISRVYWNIGRRDGNAVAEFDTELDAVLASDIFIDRDVYTIDGELIVDELIRFENLWESIGKMALRLGKSLPDPLPMAKSEHRKDLRKAADILTQAQKDRICEKADFEFNVLGFEP